jgi:hypothetical protein
LAACETCLRSVTEFDRSLSNVPWKYSRREDYGYSNLDRDLRNGDNSNVRGTQKNGDITEYRRMMA